MLRPQHGILEAQNTTAMSPRRMMSLAIVGLLHVAFIYAVITGLAQKFVKAMPAELQATVVQQPVEPPKTEPIPQPKLVQPTVVEAPTVTPPDIVIQQDVAPPIVTQATPQTPAAPPVSAAAQSVGSTHTTPPYPDMERRLGVSGNVIVHISISETGAVTNVTVSQSSGNAELDATAVDWVLKHWKYKPALASGTPVASETDAKVVFDLKHAR